MLLQQLGDMSLATCCLSRKGFSLMMSMLQLLSSSQAQAELQNGGASRMISEYGQALTGKDARLALEYYWQAAAVAGGSSSVKVNFLYMATRMNSSLLWHACL